MSKKTETPEPVTLEEKRLTVTAKYGAVVTNKMDNDTVSAEWVKIMDEKDVE